MSCNNDNGTNGPINNGCDTSGFVNLNDPKLWAEQIKTQEQLHEFINAVNSHKVTYFLTDPDGKGIDHFLHQQQIHNVIAMKDMQVIIPNNQFPIDNMHFSGLDLDLIQSFEIHVMKSAFKRTFGEEFRPGRKDVIYLCTLNQLWEVTQMIPHRGFMNAELYYRVLMKKYNDDKSRQFANTQQGQEAKDFIDALTENTTLDKLFKINTDNESKQNSKDIFTIVDNPSQQNTPQTIIKIRKNLNDKAKIVQEKLWNASLTVADYKYMMPLKSKGTKLVEYHYTDNVLNLGEDRALTMWFKTEDYSSNYEWRLFSNYDYTTNQGYYLTLYDNMLTFVYNGQDYSLDATQLKSDEWYAFLVNLDQQNDMLEIAIYKRQSEDGYSLSSSKLVLVGKRKYDLNVSSFVHNKGMFIGGCNTNNNANNKKNWYITNIRLWDTPIDIDNRNRVLNENVVTDAQLTKLVDNAEPELTLPQYGNF